MVFFLPVQPDPQQPHNAKQVDVQFPEQPHEEEEEPEELAEQSSSQPPSHLLSQSL